MILNFDDYDFADELKSRFSDFTRNADFFDGLSFNQLLKLMMKTEIVGGDTVVLFDDGLLEDSGKILVYEPDEIGPTTDDVILAAYGAGAKQSLGKVYSSLGRFIGVVVSRSQRGQAVFDSSKSYLLKRDPDASWFDSMWLMPSNFWRVAQGRGVSQAASSIGAITDLEDLCGFELQASKANAQTFAQIVRTGRTDVEEDQTAPSPFDTSEDFDGKTDEEIEQAVREQVESSGERVVSFNRAASCGIVYEQMPDDYKLELLNTQHPNDHVQEFVKWLAGRSSAAFGLSEAYATLMPSGSDFRASQLMTQPAFIEAQKFLEQICDWVFYRFVMRLVRKGEIDAGRLPDRFMSKVSWAWPQLDELDENAHQDAVEKKLRNMTSTLQKEIGPDWKEVLNQYKEEVEYCKTNGLPHPSLQMISGGMREEYYTGTSGKDSKE